MANLGKLKKSTKGSPPPKTATRKNLGKPSSGEKVPLQLKLTPEQRREIRIFAAGRDLTLSDLLWTAFAFYRDQH